MPSLALTSISNGPIMPFTPVVTYSTSVHIQRSTQDMASRISGSPVADEKRVFGSRGMLQCGNMPHQSNVHFVPCLHSFIHSRLFLPR
jgi:hypothetical protein